MATDITPAINMAGSNGGIITPAMLVEHCGMTPQNASMRLGNMTKRGEMVKVSHGKYRLPEQTPGEPPKLENPSTATAVKPHCPELVGIPHIDRDHVELIKIALVSLLEAGKKLAAVLDDADEDSALEETLVGMLREQSRQAAMLRLMLEDIGAY